MSQLVNFNPIICYIRTLETLRPPINRGVTKTQR